MKMITANLDENPQIHSRSFQDRLPDVEIPVREIIALLGAVTVATAVILLSIWMTTFEASGMMGATGWGVSLVFVALAIENQSRIAWLQLATAIGVAILAWLQQAVSPDFLIVSSVLLAAWITVVVFKWLK